MMKRIVILLVLAATACSADSPLPAAATDTPTADVCNLIANGDLANDDDGWSLGDNACVVGGECRMRFSVTPYRETWNDMCRRSVAVRPATRYRLTACGRMSLYPVSNGLYIGVRMPDGTVLKDRLVLLARDNMTPMCVEFDSGDNTNLTVFCGAWCDRDAVFYADDFRLTEI